MTRSDVERWGVRPVPRRSGLGLAAALTLLVAACATQRDAAPPGTSVEPAVARGFVVNAQGLGWADVRIELRDRRTPARTITDRDGRFELPTAVTHADGYPLAVTIPDAGPHTTLFASAARGANGEIRIVADPALRMCGIVRPPPTSTYVHTLLVRGGGTSRQEDTAPDGAFDIAWLAPEVTYTFSVWRDGIGWCEIGSGRTGAQDLSLVAP